MLERVKNALGHNTALIVALAALAAIFLSFEAGRRSAKPGVKVVQRESAKTVEIHHEATTITQKVDLDEVRQLVTQMFAQMSQHRNVVTVREIVRPDGTKETVRTEDKTVTEKSKSSSAVVKDETKQETATAATKVADDKKTVDREIVTVTTPAADPPKWGLGAGVGLSLPALLGSDVPSYLPIPKPLSVHLRLERRLFGPISAEVGVSSRAEVGLGLLVRW